jgi:hypothetical protein
MNYGYRQTPSVHCAPILLRTQFLLVSHTSGQSAACLVFLLRERVQRVTVVCCESRKVSIAYTNKTNDNETSSINSQGVLLGSTESEGAASYFAPAEIRTYRCVSVKMAVFWNAAPCGLV